MRQTRPYSFRLLILASLSSTVLIYVLAGAASAGAQASNFMVEGKITRVSPSKFTLSTEENMVFQVRYEKAEITLQDGSKGSAKDLRPGVRIKVDGDLTESGDIVASKIAIEEVPASKKS